MSLSAKLELPQTDVIVVGSGPNGISAAIRMAQAGRSVLLVEGADTLGGGVRSAELTLPGFIHDTCSSVYPLGVCSPFFRTLSLEQNGVEWVFPPVGMAHPFDDGTAAALYTSVEETSATLPGDGKNYQSLVQAFIPRWKDLLEDALAPVGLPRHPFLFAKFGLQAIRSAAGFARSHFQTDHARTFFAGMAAHALIPLEYLSTAGVGIMLALLGHVVGWPFARGGAQQLTDALTSIFRSLGGQVVTGCWVESLEQLPPARTVLMDVTPRQLLKIAGDRLPPKYRRKLERYRIGMGVFKMDWALHHPIPWRAAQCRQAGTVHLGGTLAEICESERQSWHGKSVNRPFVLLSQPSLFDSPRG